jgi:acyl carrier protein
VDTIIAALNDVFAFDVPPRLTPDTALQDIPDWDSMNAVNLIMRLESRLGVPLRGIKLNGAMTLGELDKAIQAATAGR